MSFYDLNPERPGERMARQLETLDDYRVLRCLPKPDEMWCRTMPVPESEFTLAVIDCETTGFDPDSHRMIELAIGTMSIDLEQGDITNIAAPGFWLEHPGVELPAEIQRLTHITPDMLEGQVFPDDQIAEALKGVDAIAAHNAKFDRGFVTRRFPRTANLPWICSMSEFDWAGHGLGNGRSLESLLIASGFFLPDAHRAAADVWATMCLLASPASEGTSIASRLIRNAAQDSYKIYAHKAPYELKGALKAGGYRWCPDRRVWWIEGDEAGITQQRTWLADLSPAIQAEVRAIDWVSRYA
jgi:DNA polymerase III subunit epsilon